MIYDALITPYEQPVSLREIKRALLTFDKVVLVDPADRELMPRTAYMSTIIGMPLFGIDTGPVRPMGKAAGYDERFERTIEFCKPAITQGLLEVRRTFETPTEFSIGGVDTGGYPLNTVAVYALYRAMAESQEYLHAALGNQIELLESEHRLNPEIALKGQADNGVNEVLPLPMAEAGFARENPEALTLIARGRLGGIVKYAGYCEAKGMVPVFNSHAYGPILAILLNRVRSFLQAGDRDGEYIRTSRVLNLAHDEFLLDERLDALSLDEVIKLRTRAWGNQATAREALFQAAYDIARDSVPSTDFESRVRVEIAKYKAESSDLLKERSSLKLSIKCDLGVAALGSGAAIVGNLSQIESPLPSIAMTLALGTMWALERAKEYVPKLKEMQAQSASLSRGAGLALHNYYAELPDVT
jgi:hypothetical protein